MRLGWLLALAAPAFPHDLITTPITWNREISRIVFDRCASCHRPGGQAFSLLTYAQARPWAVAIKEEVLRRRMPPWGAVKGFGEFRNEQGLTAEQLELIVSWVDGGVPEGLEKDRPAPPKPVPATRPKPLRGELVISGDFQLIKPFVLDGLLPQSVPPNSSLQIVAELPDGSLQPLLWLDQYSPAFAHPFYLRQPLTLPARTTIRGLLPGVKIALLPPAK